MASTVHTDETLASAIEELKAIIRSYDPGACFEVAVGPNAGDVYLVATVDTDDADEVTELYIDRLVDMQVDDRLPLYVLTLQSDKGKSSRQGQHNSKHRRSTV